MIKYVAIDKDSYVYMHHGHGVTILISYMIVITEKLSKGATKTVDNNEEVAIAVQDHHSTDNAG